MSGFENWPAPILRRWLLSAAAGPVIFLIGLAGRIALHDPTLLTLSTLLASCIVVRCILLFQAIRQGAYETVEGVCVAIRRASLRGQTTLILYPNPITIGRFNLKDILSFRKISICSGTLSVYIIPFFIKSA